MRAFDICPLQLYFGFHVYTSINDFVLIFHENKMSPTLQPAKFIDGDLANMILEAGKELQILKEFCPSHPLLTRGQDDAGIGINWLYRHQDVLE